MTQILIVEDQLDLLESLRIYFRERGHEVMIACTQEEAIAWLGCSQPDLALIDLLLPRGHGRQVVQEIAKRKLPTRMVVITACDDLKLKEELLSYGVSDYLFKPITIRDMEALFAPELPEAPAEIPAKSPPKS